MISLLSVLFIRNYTKCNRKMSVAAGIFYCGALLLCVALTVLCLYNCCSTLAVLTDVALALTTVLIHRNL